MSKYCTAFNRNCSFSSVEDFIEFFQMWFEDVCIYLYIYTKITIDLYAFMLEICMLLCLYEAIERIQCIQQAGKW